MLLLLIIGASFAYIMTSVTNTATTAIAVEAAGTDVLTTSSSANISINITNANMVSTAASSANATDSTLKDDGTLTVSYTAADTSGSRCSYNLVLTRTSSAVYTASSFYTSNKSTYPFEFSIQVTAGTWRGTGSAKNLAQTNISALTWSSNKATLISGADIRSNSTSVISQSWTVLIRAYNLPGNQDSLAGLNWSGTVGVENVQCGLSYS